VLATRIREAVEQVRSERSIQQSEAELRRKSRMLDVILQHVPVHIYIKDDEARHTWVSDYYMGSNEQLGKTDPEFFAQDWAEETYEEELEVIETSDPIIQQERYDPGRDMWVLNSKVPWEDEGGDVVGLVGATLDITERKEAQLELKRQKERLEKFIGVMSHDLRNPLDLAMGRLEVAREECDSEHLDHVADAHDRMRRIIDETLTLARQGRTAEDLETIRLPTLARDSWDGIDTADATLDVEDVGVTATKTGLRHLFENLFGNAVQHGGDDVAVRVGALEDGAGFFVADDGPGIPEDDREAIFEVGHTTADDGIGFGLSIVEEVAQAHDWDVTVADSDAGGARFEFRDVEVESFD
jgi:PAS domain S-box-containing protein